MRILLVDDEPQARRRLVALLAELELVPVGEAANGVEALELVPALRPDVLLLDIAMPEVDGFDVVRHLEEPKPLVIFQTAYDEHALKAFEHEAVDYVLKPVTRERLAQALERARRRLQERSGLAVAPEVLARLAETLREGSVARRPRLLVRQGRGHRLLPFAEVLRFEAVDGVVFAYTREGRHLADYPLAEIEARAGSGFVRTNRAELVNLDAIERIDSNGDGSALLTLQGGATVRVSRRRAADVRRAAGG